MAGAELLDPTATWPGLYARHRGLEYQCLAQVGRTSQFVLRTLFSSLRHEVDPCLYVIHWPSACRYEYVDRQRDTWVQINPNNTIDGNDTSEQVKLNYYANVNSLLGDKWHNLLMIHVAQKTVANTQHRLCMTTVDDFLYATDFHAPDYVLFLQDQTRDHVRDFNGQTFTRWAEINSFAIGPRGHPQDTAHRAAFDLLGPAMDKIIT